MRASLSRNVVAVLLALDDAVTRVVEAIPDVDAALTGLLYGSTGWTLNLANTVRQALGLRLRAVAVATNGVPLYWRDGAW